MVSLTMKGTEAALRDTYIGVIDITVNNIGDDRVWVLFPGEAVCCLAEMEEWCGSEKLIGLDCTNPLPGPGLF